MGPVTVSNSTFSNNTAQVTGGAIFSEQTVTVSNSTFSNNTSQDLGGAIFSEETVTVSNSTFSNNTGELGGAIMAGAVTVSGSLFSGNLAEVGGAISGYSVVVSESTFSNNAASNGGAIISLFADPFESSPGFPGYVFATNSTFVNNSAFDEGGAIFATEGNVYFSTFVNNVASTPLSLETAEIPGNAIYKSGTETLTLAGNIFAGNNNSFPQLGTGGTLPATPFTDGGGNIFSTSAEPDISGTYAPVFEATLTSLFGTNSPTLATYAPNTNGTQTIGLAPGSPALNAVPDLAPFNLITLDQRGATRTFPADAGAFEGFVIPTSTPTSTTPAVLAKTGNENLFWSTLASGTLIVFGTLVAVVISRIRRRTSNL
jgi:predicted outer membrane repeat protein